MPVVLKTNSSGTVQPCAVLFVSACHTEGFTAQKCRSFFRRLDYCLRVLYELQIYERAVDLCFFLLVSSAEDRKRARPSVCSSLPIQLSGNVFRPRMLCFGL